MFLFRSHGPDEVAPAICLKPVLPTSSRMILQLLCMPEHITTDEGVAYSSGRILYYELQTGNKPGLASLVGLGCTLQER